MVDLTYLCFVFLNDRSDAWWEMQWAACQGRDNSRERPRESCIHSQFTRISAVFKVSNFFLHYYWLLREQLFPSLLPNYHPHTDRQAADGETHCVHEVIQFSNETNVLHQGGDVAALEEEEESKVQTQSREQLGLMNIPVVLLFCCSSSCLYYVFVYSYYLSVCLYVYLSISM